MKILFVTRGFPSEQDPMAGNYEAVQAKAIAAKGHEVSVIGIKWLSLRHVFTSTKVSHRVVDGINVYEATKVYPGIRYINLPKWERFTKTWIFRKVFNKYVKECGMPDIVHVHIILYAPPAVFLKTKYNLPFVITEHWTKMNTEKLEMRVRNQTFAYRYADRVICVSEALAESLRKKCNIESLVINNMVSDQFFESRKTERKDCQFRFIGVGALRKNKRFDVLVEAFALCKFPENVRLDIVGEGEERSLIESKIKEYDVGKQVHLLGVKTPEEVNKLLCQSDCFVLSSRLETFAIVVIEALAKGLPVIATRCGGPETFVRPKDGLLVEKENAQELAKALKYMAEHYRDYNADEIRQHCRDNFSQDVIADKIIDVYRQVMKKQ